jgi:hypothetical protein
MPNTTDETRALPNPPPGFREIGFVDFEADKPLDTGPLRGDGGISNPEKRVEHGLDFRGSVQLDAPLR